jgi:hypothetical protein
MMSFVRDLLARSFLPERLAGFAVEGHDDELVLGRRGFAAAKSAARSARTAATTGFTFCPRRKAGRSAGWRRPWWRRLIGSSWRNRGRRRLGRLRRGRGRRGWGRRACGNGCGNKHHVAVNDGRPAAVARNFHLPFDVLGLAPFRRGIGIGCGTGGERAAPLRPIGGLEKKRCDGKEEGQSGFHKRCQAAGV